MIQAEGETRKSVDPAVISAAQRLDPAALDCLVDIYAPRLFGFFRRDTGRLEDAEDLVQEVFVRLVRMISEYRDDGRFDAWIFRIATNLLRDRFRRARCSPAGRSLDDDTSDRLSSAGRLSDESTDPPSRRLEALDESSRLETALGCLPEAERMVVLLRHYGGLSFQEIADLMGTPLGTALARAHRGLRKLREWMETL